MKFYNKTDRFAFRDDSVSNFNEQNVVKFNFIPSIKKSKAVAELRIYTSSGRTEFLKIFRFYKDSISVSRYLSMFITVHKKDTAEYNSMKPTYTYLGKADDQQIYIRKVMSKTIQSPANAEKFLNDLLNNGIGSLPDGKILDSLLKQKFPKLIQYDEGIGLIELKVGDHYRNFSMSRLRYNSDREIEEKIKPLADKNRIFNTLNQIEESK